jgi:alginate O-acetyltransferase complex protein AlgI
MLMFNSLNFIFFLIIFFLIYWKLDRKKQNILLLIASYLFYASWDWRFLSLIIFSTFLDFIIGKLLYDENKPKKRKWLLSISIIGNLTILAFFKYYNFFIENLEILFSGLGLNISNLHLSIILPIGISFYTFQTLSYTIDIYRREIKPTGSIITFAVFVAFFPQLVAGPIERAKNFIPQLLKKRIFSYSRFFRGIDLILWGLLKKIVIADNIAYYVNFIFNLKEPSTLLIIVGTIGFGIQIFSDFSAYSDIARGSAKLFGIELMINFKNPYLAKNPSDFWKRWHISLSTWVRDYIYIPLGGSRVSKFRYLINIILTWFLMGLWHGAAWHFIIWGLFHGTMIILYNKIIKPITSHFKNLNILFTIFGIIITNIIVFFGWLLFRMENISDLWFYFSKEMINKSIIDFEISLIIFSLFILFSLPYLLSFIVDKFQKDYKNYPYYTSASRILIYTILILLIIIFQPTSSPDFIYFQF